MESVVEPTVFNADDAPIVQDALAGTVIASMTSAPRLSCPTRNPASKFTNELELPPN